MPFGPLGIQSVRSAVRTFGPQGKGSRRILGIEEEPATLRSTHNKAIIKHTRKMMQARLSL